MEMLDVYLTTCYLHLFAERVNNDRPSVISVPCRDAHLVPGRTRAFTTKYRTD